MGNILEECTYKWGSVFFDIRIVDEEIRFQAFAGFSPPHRCIRGRERERERES